MKPERYPQSIPLSAEILDRFVNPDYDNVKVSGHSFFDLLFTRSDVSAQPPHHNGQETPQGSSYAGNAGDQRKVRRP